ncbi:MAG TPA: hypothetical protein VGO62_10500, partial [Myxococcota bacterium]
ELVGGSALALGGAVGAMALFSQPDQSLEGAGVALAVIVVPPSIAFAIIGGVSTYAEATRDLEPRLPPEIADKRADWIKAPLPAAAPAAPAASTSTGASK